MMKRFASALALLFGASCTPVADLPILSPSSASLDPAEPYAVITLEDETTFLGTVGLCLDDRSDEYSLAYRIMACSSPTSSFMVGKDARLFSADRYRLSNGALVRIVPLDQYGSLLYRSVPGEYIVIGRQAANGVRYIFTGEVEAHQIDPAANKIIYLGHVSDFSSGPSWRERGDLKALLVAEFPGLSPERIVVDAPATRIVSCTTANCVITARNEGPSQKP